MDVLDVLSNAVLPEVSLEFAGAEWRLVAMCIVWAIANRVQVRRGGSGA